MLDPSCSVSHGIGLLYVLLPLSRYSDLATLFRFLQQLQQPHLQRRGKSQAIERRLESLTVIEWIKKSAKTQIAMLRRQLCTIFASRCQCHLSRMTGAATPR